MGKIEKKIDNNSGIILGEDGKSYIFTIFDILDNTKIIKETIVEFKPLEDKFFRATYVSKYKELDD